MSSHLTKYVESDFTRHIQPRIPDVRILSPEDNAAVCVFFTDLGREEICRKMGINFPMERDANKVNASVADIAMALSMNLATAQEMSHSNRTPPNGRGGNRAKE